MRQSTKESPKELKTAKENAMTMAKAKAKAKATAKAKAMVTGMTRASARARERATREERGTVAGAGEGEFIMGREGITFKHSFNEMTSRLNYKDNTESLRKTIKRNS